MSYIHRAPISAETKEIVWENAKHIQVDENGQMVSPNGTGKSITEETKVDIGHRNEFENRYEVDFSSKAGLTQEEHNELFTNPGTFQIEPHDENISHLYECKNNNEGMQNVSAYAYSQDSNIAANTYINPSDGGKSGTISVVNAQTGEESTVCTYELNDNNNEVNSVTNSCDSNNVENTVSTAQPNDESIEDTDDDLDDISDDDAYTV